MSFGKSSSSSAPVTTEEQKAAIRAQTAMLTGTVIPAYNQAIGGATETYNRNAGGVLNAAQNQAAMARQAQDVLGSTGESALRTGISGLESVFDPGYMQQQIGAATAPAQAQYLQNLEMQQRGFGGAGNLGSARQALADRALAGQNQGQQQQIAAQVANNIMGQRLGAANQLAGYGQGGIGQALGAAGSAVTASMAPQALYNQYASVLFGTPAASYTPDFRGTQGSNTTGYKAGLDFGIKLPGQ
jgi:hypothetical protein